MAQASFTLRVRTPAGMKRFQFDNANTKFSVFQQKLKVELGIEPEHQYLSKKPLADPEFLIDCGDFSFAQLNLVNGDILNIVLEAEIPKKKEDNKAVHKMTNKCQHGPKDRCIHCAYGDLGKKTKFVCNHPATAKCNNCSQFEASGKGACNHPPTAFCPNCAPEEEKDPNKPNEDAERMKRMFCHCKNGQKCVYCSVQVSAVKVDMIPFQRHVDELRAMCHFKHGPKTQCPSCEIEPLPNFKGNPKCTNGHLPWPNGCCSKCMPPNAVLKPQAFRHCDYLSFQDDRIGNKFVSEWLKNPFIQRAAILIGYFVDEPEETKNPGAVRAHVHAMYYPPQENSESGVRFLKDSKEENVLAIAAKLGMQPVGWCITTPPRLYSEKYGGEMILSANEVRQAAAFQSKFKDPNTGRSKFLTVLFKLNEQQQVEPVAYQVSDQCVALERDNVFANTDDIGMLAIRAPKSSEMMPGLMYKDKLMNPGEPFLPDEFIVKAVASAPLKSKPFFTHVKFPFVGTNAMLQAHLNQVSKDDWPIKVSDFNALIHLTSVVGLQTTLNVCTALKESKSLGAQEKLNLEKALKLAGI